MTLLVNVLATFFFFIAHFLQSLLIPFDLFFVSRKHVFEGFFNFAKFFFEILLYLRVVFIWGRISILVVVVGIFKEVLELVKKHDTLQFVRHFPIYNKLFLQGPRRKILEILQNTI
jgi:hypothetical protein